MHNTLRQTASAILQHPPIFSTTIRVVALALAFWLGREVTIPAAIVRQVGFAHAATPGMIVARIGFAHSLIEPYGALCTAA